MNNLTSQELGELSGRTARLWHFTASHDRLVFRLYKPGDKLVNYLVFLGCEVMHISACLKFDNPKIEKGQRASYQLTDGELNIQFEESLIMDDYDFS